MSKFADELSTKDVAARLGHSHSAILEWARRGHLPHRLTPGGHRRFRVSDVEAFEARMRGGGFGPYGQTRVERDVVFLHKPGSKKLEVVENGHLPKKKAKPGIKPASKASK